MFTAELNGIVHGPSTPLHFISADTRVGVGVGVGVSVGVGVGVGVGVEHKPLTYTVADAVA